MSNFKKAFYTVILFLIVGNLYGKSKVNYLPADSLLKWFENAKHPLHVWDSIRDWKIRSNFRTEFDYKSYYQEPRLKTYLMKWLERDLYYQYEIQEARKDFEPKNKDDSAYMEYKIIGWIKNKKTTINADSVLNDPSLYGLYKDSVIDQRLENKIKRMEKLGKPYPFSQAIYFHMRMSYPESYNQIRKFWVQTGKKIEKNDYFIPLVKMGDPEARKIFNKIIDEFIEKNGDVQYFSVVYSNIDNNLHGAYGTVQLLKLLNVDKKINVFSEGEATPVNCDFISSLVSGILKNKIDIDPSVSYFDSCEKHFENIDEIKEASQRLIEYYEEQEYYWMSNMPFYEE